jgi:cytochrome c peroxidase
MCGVSNALERVALCCALVGTLGLSACAASTRAVEERPVVEQQHPIACGCEEGSLEKKRELGRRLFEDRNLSVSGTESCASCHGAERAFSGNNQHDDPLFPVAIGAFPDLVGTRNTPTAMYMAFSPAFSFVAEEEDGEPAYTPTGGQFWDGRADTLAQQAAGPFLNPREMGLPGKENVIERVRAADYAPLFDEAFGEGLWPDTDVAYDKLTEAIAAFESTDEFAPFSSKFDAVLRGSAEFSEQEARGFALFKDPTKANCIACHAADPDSSDPHSWLFTDFTYDNLGVPRNRLIPENEDGSFFDLGLCQRPGLRDRLPELDDPDAFVESLCGAFKVPTLRNVAKTAPYMHNGYFTTLRDVVEFYVTRDTNPGKWYPADAYGAPDKFDDLPDAYKANVNTEEVPYDRKLGEEPRLTPDEIDDVVAFLHTLSDGYAD